jgi:hypothetical protein
MISNPTGVILIPQKMADYYQLILIDPDSAVSGQFSAFSS